jgi:hypothetical protein
MLSGEIQQRRREWRFRREGLGSPGWVTMSMKEEMSGRPHPFKCPHRLCENPDKATLEGKETTLAEESGVMEQGKLAGWRAAI